jgi:hypothetical protein
MHGRLFRAGFDAHRGVLVSLTHRRHVPGVDFICPQAAAEPHPFALPDELALGRVRIRWRPVRQRAWQVADEVCGGIVRLRRSGRRVVGVSTSSPGGGVLAAASEFRLLEGDALRWRVEVCNASDAPLEVGEVSFPLPFNTRCVAPDMRTMYEERVTIHPFAAGHGSSVLVQALCGRPPFLLLMPEGDTALEAMARDQDPRLAPAGLLAGGVLRVYACSRASRQVLGWHEWFNGHTSFMLKPGERRMFSFAFRWIDSYAGLDDALRRHGVGSVKVLPAPVVPTNMGARLAVSTRRRVERIRCPGARVRRLDEGRYLVRFERPGSYTARISFDDGRWTAVHLRAIEPVAELIRKRAAFIARKQQVLDEKDARYGAFLMWDCEDDALVREARAPYFVGGSDELGFADALFLAAKNALMPDERERKALARYVEHFLHGKLERPDDYGVVLWFGDEVWHHYKGSDVCRSFNYLHVVNVYHALYRAAKRFGPAGGLDARELLLRAYRTGVALYTHTMIAGDAVTIGNMGQSELLSLAQSLRDEGFADERRMLLRQMGRSARRYARVRYPYGSEFAYDTTGYETVYFFRKARARGKARGRDDALAGEALDVTLATRHHAPAWYLAGNDVRWGIGNGKNWRVADELSFSYMAALNGLAVQDAYEASGDQFLLGSAYASALGLWALVREDGAGRYVYTWEPARMLFDPWSSEGGLGLFGALLQQRAYVVEDADFGLIGYGCDVRRVRDGAEIVPLDGLRCHVVWRERELRVVAEPAVIERLVVQDGGRLTLELCGVGRSAHEAHVRIEKLGGAFEVVVDGRPAGTVRSVRGRLDIPVRVRPLRRVLVELVPVRRR